MKPIFLAIKELSSSTQLKVPGGGRRVYIGGQVLPGTAAAVVNGDAAQKTNQGGHLGSVAGLLILEGRVLVHVFHARGPQTVRAAWQ